MENREKLGWPLVGVMVWGVLSGVSTIHERDTIHAAMKPMAGRNMNVFNQMADVQGLNDRGRAVTWGERQAAITREIGLNGNDGFDWIPFFFKDYGLDLLKMADKNQIALVPAQQGQDTTLIVDNSHGCLLVDFTKSDAELANEARRVLGMFKQTSASQYEYHGRYALAGEQGERYTTPLGLGVKNVKAADYCPAPKP